MLLGDSLIWEIVLKVKIKMPFSCSGFCSARGRVASASEKLRIVIGDVCLGTMIIVLPA